MKQTREQRLTELLQASTTNTTAHSLVHAMIINARALGWAWAWFFWFGIIGWGIAGAQHNETGFAMIDQGKIYFYKVTGAGKRQIIEGRREIVFERIERVYRAKGGWLAPATLKIRWRNNKNIRLDLILGNATGGFAGTARRHFPNQQTNINEMTQLILANNVEIKPDRTTRNILLLLLLLGIPLFMFIVMIIGIVVEVL